MVCTTTIPPLKHPPLLLSQDQALFSVVVRHQRQRALVFLSGRPVRPYAAKADGISKALSSSYSKMAAPQMSPIVLSLALGSVRPLRWHFLIGARSGDNDNCADWRNSQFPPPRLARLSPKCQPTGTRETCRRSLAFSVAEHRHRGSWERKPFALRRKHKGFRSSARWQ